MATLDIPNAYAGVAPLIITSPATRCGTTLAQRLISASDNAFIYGEEIGNQIKELTNQFLSVIQYCEGNEAALAEDFRQAFEGSLTDWRPGLAPPAPVMLKTWVETYYQLPAQLAAFGQSVGRPVWGFKWPAYPPLMVSALLTLMPHAKVLYVLRNPVDALQSAKARRFVQSPQEAAGFCAAWRAHFEAFRSMPPDPRVLWVKYEDLLAEKHRSLAAIEAFTGVRNIRHDAFAVKVNTYRGEAAQGRAPTQYIEPEILTDAEFEAVRAHVAPILAQVYPEDARFS